jgi:hypothetical protein
MRMTTSRLRRFTYALALTSCGIGAATLPFRARLALLPTAVAFGWSQIGGL